MSSLVTATIAVLASLATAAAGATCLYPQPPAAVPNGATATYEEMAAARQVITDFDADIRSYNLCLQLEARRLLDERNLDAAAAQSLMLQLVEYNDAAVEHVEQIVERFNEQLRIFRERDRKELSPAPTGTH
jgi:hypothetical protein